MRRDKGGQLLYVFHAVDDKWLDELEEIFTGPLAWESDEFWREWINYDAGLPFPSEFAQLMTTYRYLDATPGEAVDMLVKHPDYDYLAEDWKETNRNDDREP